MEAIKKLMDEKYKTVFKKNNNVVMISQNKLYLRKCRSFEDIKDMKKRLEHLISSRQEKKAIWIEEGYHKESDTYFIVYS